MKNQIYNWFVQFVDNSLIYHFKHDSYFPELVSVPYSNQTSKTNFLKTNH